MFGRERLKISGMLMAAVLAFWCCTDLPTSTHRSFVPLTLDSLMMANIPSGTFIQAGHSVILSSFQISKTEITQEQYAAIMGLNPSQFNGNILRPVENVTWFDAVLFCNALSKLYSRVTLYTYTAITGSPGNGCTGLANIAMDSSKHGYRLPTEAEFEYACRAGTTTVFYWGDSLNKNYFWCRDNSYDSTQPVGRKLPNSLGLYDMIGNVLEWCNDRYGPYAVTAQTDPLGSDTGSCRVLRGGYSWNQFTSYGTNGSASRNYDNPVNIRNNYGFRVVLK